MINIFFLLINVVFLLKNSVYLDKLCFLREKLCLSREKHKFIGVVVQSACHISDFPHTSARAADESSVLSPAAQFSGKWKSRNESHFGVFCTEVFVMIQSESQILLYEHRDQGRSSANIPRSENGKIHKKVNGVLPPWRILPMKKQKNFRGVKIPHLHTIMGLGEITKTWLRKKIVEPDTLSIEGWDRCIESSAPWNMKQENTWERNCY